MSSYKTCSPRPNALLAPQRGISVFGAAEPTGMGTAGNVRRVLCWRKLVAMPNRQDEWEHQMSSLTALNEQAQRATLGWYADPGHAWLAVSLDEEHGLPIATQFASNFSYIDATGDNFAGIVYLEEDEDAVAFIKAYGIELAGLPEWHIVIESEIRNLPRGTKS